VELGSGLDVVDADGNTALHRAADEGIEPVVKLLTERGANAEIKNNKGKTALEDAWPPQAKPVRRSRRER
jgi:ankyrin repeat protein